MRKAIRKRATRLDKERADWIQRITSLVNQVAEWSSSQGWKVERHQKQITEDRLGTYQAPELIVYLPEGELEVVPAGLDIIGGDGRIDLEAIPTLARVKIVGEKGGWKLLADPNVPLRLEWNRENFIQLGHDLLS